MFAGGLKIDLPTATPATPWLETVVAAVSQTAAAEYQSPTPTTTETSMAAATATVTGTAYAAPASGDAPLGVNPALSAAGERDGTPYWMFLYFMVSFGFVAFLFVGYLRLVVFRTFPLKK
jgi:hypothetical protein